ncbi:hypothetical protein PL1_0824 [Paenibacillus larvae subsp. larvae B-3650]|nr:hypothetical protein PL1_0824 [Paenibacillus larvae subsp. larvae B-3650]
MINEYHGLYCKKYNNDQCYKPPLTAALLCRCTAFPPSPLQVDTPRLVSRYYQPMRTGVKKEEVPSVGQTSSSNRSHYIYLRRLSANAAFPFFSKQCLIISQVIRTFPNRRRSAMFPGIRSKEAHGFPNIPLCWVKTVTAV